LWTLFGVVVTGLLAVDLFLFHGKKRPLRASEALLWSMVWIAVALLFNGFVCFQFGTERGLEFLTGYLIEKALAVDNLPVFVLIFSYFGIPSTRRHRVLFFGVVGALVLRAGFIAAGASLLAHFHWLGYLFGAFLAVTGLKLLRRTHQLRPEANPFFRMLRKVIPVINADADQFFVRRNSRLFATPLFLALLLIELSDIIFAVDSIPAIFAVTSDAFIVLTSNIFAILGLRAMYTLVADILVRLKIPARRSGACTGIRGHKDVGCLLLRNSCLGLARSSCRASQCVSNRVACPSSRGTAPGLNSEQS
jgi:tellurite resistance protein TerC